MTHLILNHYNVYNIQHFRENVKSLLLTKLNAVYIPQAKAWGLDGTADKLFRKSNSAFLNR